MPEPFVLTEELRRVLDALPQEPGRSRLEPLRAYILRWRREGRSYRRIQSILENQCGVRISYESLREFVVRRSRPRKQMELEPEPEPITVQEKLPKSDVKADRWAAERERMRQHKAQPVVERKPDWKLFDYDEDSAHKPLYSVAKKEEK
jgi:hypothetical protein